MNLSRAWFAGILVGGVAVWAVCDNAWAQAWQDASADSAAPHAEWQQRVLKHPQQPQWHAAGQSADSSDQPTQLTQATDQYQQAATPRRTTSSYRTARRSMGDGDVFDSGIAPKEPAASGRQRAPATGGPEVIPPGQLQFEPVAAEGTFAGPGGCANCGGPGEACGDCGGCDSCCGPSCGDCCDFGWEVFDGHCGPFLRGVSVFMGADGFKSDGADRIAQQKRHLRRKRGSQYGPTPGRSLGMRLPDWRQFRAKRLCRNYAQGRQHALCSVSKAILCHGRPVPTRRSLLRRIPGWSRLRLPARCVQSLWQLYSVQPPANPQ